MSSSTARVLCIDDESEIRRDVADELQDAGYEILEASNGAEGLDVILRQKPDLVVCDITMPVLSGHDLLRKLRDEHPERADLPFIFLSALADKGHIIEGKRLGADDYLTKPIDFDLLLATVESRLNQVRRMAARKEEELVKVYRAALFDGEEAAGDAELAVGVRDQEREDDAVGFNVSPYAGPRKDSRAQIAEIVASSSERVVGGRLQLVGLDEVREVVGGHWGALSKKINDIAESTIRRRLSSEDVVEKLDNGDFLICFASLGEAEAVLKAGAICREIKDKILGSELLDSEIKDLCDVRSEVEEIKVTRQEAAESESVFDLMSQRLEEASERSSQRYRETMAQIVDSCRIEPIPLVTLNGAKLPIFFSEFNADARNGIVMLRRTRPDSSEFGAELDCLRLVKIAEYFSTLEQGPTQIVVADVEFSTLMNRCLRERYLRLCQSLTKAARQHLAFNVRNITNDLLPARIETTVGFIRPFCRLLMIEARKLQLGTVDPLDLRAKVVSCDFGNIASIFRNSPDDLRIFAATVHKKGCRLFVHNVPSAEEEKGLFHSGVNFLARRAGSEAV